MNVRTIASPAVIEVASRSGHQGATAAQTNNAERMVNVVPTFHQLLANDSSANGIVASNSSLPDRRKLVVSVDMRTTDIEIWFGGE